MTDRELLELAAKAAGMVVHAGHQAGRDALGAADVGLWVINVSTCWNPLEDDGDALRLAVALKMLVNVNTDFTHVAPGSNEDFEEFHYGDPYAATRRAIVRAAAEIGRAMP